MIFLWGNMNLRMNSLPTKFFPNALTENKDIAQRGVEGPLKIWFLGSKPSKALFFSFFNRKSDCSLARLPSFSSEAEGNKREEHGPKGRHEKTQPALKKIRLPTGQTFKQNRTSPDSFSFLSLRKFLFVTRCNQRVPNLSAKTTHRNQEAAQFQLYPWCHQAGPAKINPKYIIKAEWKQNESAENSAASGGKRLNLETNQKW